MLVLVPMRILQAPQPEPDWGSSSLD